MNIYIDESGTFPSTNTPNSWSVIAAYTSPESDRKLLFHLVEQLRRRDSAYTPEVKLGKLSEVEYFNFLKKLAQLNGLVFVAATDMSQNTVEVIKMHQAAQASNVIANIEMMRHQSMKDSLEEISRAIYAMPTNLYTQLIFQISLFHEIVLKSTLYYVQRTPQTLRELRWRVDQKDVQLTGYEKVFRQLLPAILQSISISKPFLMLEGCDYSYMAQYEYSSENRPTYLSKEYGLPDSDGFNLGKLVGGNFKFVDSKAEFGVQVADLIASGFRRLLKCEFSDNTQAALLLGQLCLQGNKGDVPLKLFTMGEERTISGELAKVLLTLQKRAKRMLR